MLVHDFTGVSWSLGGSSHVPALGPLLSFVPSEQWLGRKYTQAEVAAGEQGHTHGEQ